MSMNVQLMRREDHQNHCMTIGQVTDFDCNTLSREAFEACLFAIENQRLPCEFYDNPVPCKVSLGQKEIHVFLVDMASEVTIVNKDVSITASDAPFHSRLALYQFTRLDESLDDRCLKDETKELAKAIEENVIQALVIVCAVAISALYALSLSFSISTDHQVFPPKPF